jgi:hypothetical protein
MTDRTTWKDVERAALALTHAWHTAGGTTPTTLTVEPGSVTNGHAGTLGWAGTNGSGYTLPGSPTLPRSAADAYDNITARAGALLSVAAVRRNRYQTLTHRAEDWSAAHAERDDVNPVALALIAELVAALTEGWAE